MNIHTNNALIRFEVHLMWEDTIHALGYIVIFEPTYTQDFFNGQNRFEKDEVIELIMHVDAHAEADEESFVSIEIVGTESGEVKATHEFGPVEEHHRLSFVHHIVVDFENPEEHHEINVSSNETNLAIGFTLDAHVKHPLTDNSVIVAACIMIAVYFFILIEVIHNGSGNRNEE